MIGCHSCVVNLLTRKLHREIFQTGHVCLKRLNGAGQKHSYKVRLDSEQILFAG